MNKVRRKKKRLPKGMRAITCCERHWLKYLLRAGTDIIVSRDLFDKRRISLRWFMDDGVTVVIPIHVNTFNMLERKGYIEFREGVYRKRKMLYGVYDVPIRCGGSAETAVMHYLKQRYMPEDGFQRLVNVPKSMLKDFKGDMLSVDHSPIDIPRRKR